MLRRLVALVLAPAFLLGAVGVTRATAGDANAASFVAKTNAARSARGLRPYVVKSDLAAVAARHSARMASTRSLHHNPALGSEVSGWQVVGENVGNGGSVDSIHRALMNSPTHRANIVAADLTEIGVGTVTDGRGTIWVTQVFRLPFRTPVVTAPVTARATRSMPRARTQPAANPVEPVVKVGAARRPAPPVRAGAREFLSALAQGAPPNAVADPLTLAMSFAGTMGALSR